jgi:hypothetical protein
MYHLVYISYEARPMQEEDLLDILNESRLNNKKYNVTGMLVYLHGKFIQVLEGEYNEVSTIYEGIVKDPRHRKVTTVLEGNTAQRIFKDWSMGFKKLSHQQFEQLSGFKDPDEFFSNAHVTNDSPAVMIFLTLFYKKNLTDYPEEISY